MTESPDVGNSLDDPDEPHMPVEALLRDRIKPMPLLMHEAEEDPATYGFWRRAAALCPADLGWMLTLLLPIILGVNIALIAISLSHYDRLAIYFVWVELPKLWTVIIFNLAPVARIAAVVGIWNTKRWAIITYLFTTFAFLLFAWYPEFNPVHFYSQIVLFVALMVLVFPRWEQFD